MHLKDLFNSLMAVVHAAPSPNKQNAINALEAGVNTAHTALESATDKLDKITGIMEAVGAGSTPAGEALAAISAILHAVEAGVEAAGADATAKKSP